MKQKIKNCLIIPAAGKGTRFNSSVPKVFVKINNKPLIYHTLKPFLSLNSIELILIVLNKEYINEYQQIVSKYLKDKNFYFILGGKERQDSIYNALKFLIQNSITPQNVIIHDGARPYVKQNVIKSCIKELNRYKAVITAVPVTDTIKMVDNDLVVKTIPRDNLYLIQTPQGYNFELLVKAYKNAYKNNLFGTDDATLIEYLGEEIKVISGDKLNIKLTTKEELKIIKLLLQ